MLLRGLGVSVAQKPLGGDGEGGGPATRPASFLAPRREAMPRGEETRVVTSLPGLPALPLTSCVTSDTSLNLSESQFIYLTNGDAIYKCLTLTIHDPLVGHAVNVTGWVPSPGCGLNIQQDSGGSRCPPAPKPPPQSGLQQ